MVSSDIPDADPSSVFFYRDTSCKAVASSLGSRTRFDRRDGAQYDPPLLLALTFLLARTLYKVDCLARTAFSLFAIGCCSRARKSWLCRWREAWYGIRSRCDE